MAKNAAAAAAGKSGSILDMIGERVSQGWSLTALSDGPHGLSWTTARGADAEMLMRDVLGRLSAGS